MDFELVLLRPIETAALTRHLKANVMICQHEIHDLRDNVDVVFAPGEPRTPLTKHQTAAAFIILSLFLLVTSRVHVERKQETLISSLFIAGLGCAAGLYGLYLFFH